MMAESKTNGDRIRAMNDAELAAWISNFVLECVKASGIEDASLECGFQAMMQEWLERCE